MNENDEIELRNKLKELIRLNIKPNFAALGRAYGCDYRTAKVKYYEEQNKEKGIDISEEDIVRSDKQSQVNYLSTLVDKGIISRNEARKQLGYAPVEGGDELMIAYSDPNQNKITGEERVIVSDIAGTTRDAIDSLVENKFGKLAGLAQQYLFYWRREK